MITKRSQTRKGRRPPSLSTLNKLWRKRVLERWKCQCVICGKVQPPENLEAHHIIHRSQSGLLKWHLSNGAAVCKGQCHNDAHREWGKEAIRRKLGEAAYGELIDLDRQTIKGYIASRGMTRAEWLREQKERLMADLPPEGHKWP